MAADRKARSIGQFKVVATRRDVANFRAAACLDLGPDDPAPQQVPLTYPVSWLTRGEAGAAVRSIPGLAGGICIQTGQAVHIVQPLALDTPYRMDVEWQMLDASRRTFEVTARIADEMGGEMLRMRSTLCVLATRGHG